MNSKQRKRLSVGLWLHEYRLIAANYDFLMIHQTQRFIHRAFELQSERQMMRQYKFRLVAYFVSGVGGASEWWCHFFKFIRHIWNCFETFPFNPELCPVLRSSASFSTWNCGRMVIKEDSHISAWGQLSHEPSSTHKHTKKKNNSKASSFSSICYMWRLSRISHTKLTPLPHPLGFVIVVLSPFD